MNYWQSISQIKENQLIIPSTTKLTFNISLLGTDVNRTLAKNLGRNVIRKLIVKLEGNEIISIDDYDVLYLYYDCWKCTTERHNAVFQGIVEADGQTENAIKHRINASDKANNAKDQTVASIYNNCFCIPLDFEVLGLFFTKIGIALKTVWEKTMLFLTKMKGINWKSACKIGHIQSLFWNAISLLATICYTFVVICLHLL